VARITDDIAWSVVVGVESAHFYSAFLPSIFTIEKFGQQETDIRALRRGEVIATVFTLLLGWAAGELVDSPYPLYASLTIAVLMLAVYEMALRKTLDKVNLPLIGAAAIIPGVPPV
jgi:hypothetical protein